jgi:hypothetical protein
MITPNDPNPSNLPRYSGESSIASTGVMENRLGSYPEQFHTSVDKPFARVSWGAIFAGAATAMATLLILSLLGLGIGLSTVDPATGDTPSGTAMGIGALLWYLLSSAIALFAGGFVAGRLAGNFNGYLHGIVTWSVVTVASVLLVSSAIGRIFSGATGLAQFAGSVPGMSQSAAGQAQDQMKRLQSSPTERQQTEQKVREAGQQAARGGAMGAFGAVVALIVGAGAAAYGGTIGKRRFFEAAPQRQEFRRADRI